MYFCSEECLLGCIASILFLLLHSNGYRVGSEVTRARRLSEFRSTRHGIFIRRGKLGSIISSYLPFLGVRMRGSRGFLLFTFGMLQSVTCCSKRCAVILYNLH